MMRTITGLFDSIDDAQGAAKDLVDRGVPHDQISLVAQQAAGAKELSVGERPSAPLADGLSDSLIGAGVPEEQVQLYAEGVRRGGTVLAVRAGVGSRIPVDEVLCRYGVADIERRHAEWRVDAEWRTNDADITLPQADRAPATYSTPNPTAPHMRRAYQDENTDETGYLQPTADFRAHYERTYAGGQPYSQYESAYLFGYRLATDPRSAG